MYLDEREQREGWEAFPDGQAAAEAWKDDVKQHIEQQQHEQQQQHAAAAEGAAGGRREVSHGAVAAPQGAADRDVLALEPPQWLPDSYSSACSGCHLQFRPLTRLKHHCRMCGKIFCHSCCHKRMLLPPKFASREPQRVCELCSCLLGPLQLFLAGTQAAAVQPPVHDSIDSVSLRSWLNSPWSSGLEGDIYKGANILQTFTRAIRLRSEQSLPMAVLQGCRALVILSSVKLGAGWSCSFGTGLVVARSPSGGWSAPCAVACCGFGWGLQFGGELADMVLVLRTEEQLAACCAGTQLGLGGNLGLAMGPMGRHADAAVMLGTRGTTAPVFSYSCSKGAFIGAALEGSVMMVRSAVNEKFYGYSVSASQILLGDGVPQPPAASTLYDALHVLVHKYEISPPLTPAQLQQYAQYRQEQDRQYGEQQGTETSATVQQRETATELAVGGSAAVGEEQALASATTDETEDEVEDEEREAEVEVESSEDEGGAWHGSAGLVPGMAAAAAAAAAAVPAAPAAAAAAPAAPAWSALPALSWASAPSAPAAAAPASAPPMADWAAAAASTFRPPAFMLSSAPTAQQPALQQQPQQHGRSNSMMFSAAPAAASARSATAGGAPTLRSRARQPQRQQQQQQQQQQMPPQQQQQQEEEDLPYGFLFDD